MNESANAIGMKEAVRRRERPRFWLSTEREPHSRRVKSILAAHPGVRRLIGRNPWTGVLVLCVVGLQTAIAAGFGLAPAKAWPLILIAAWGLGSIANHGLYAMIHELSHDLVFRRRFWNKAFAIIADLPNLAPGAIAFRTYHLIHHSHLGEPDVDADLPSAWEERVFGNSPLGKALWLFLFPVVQVFRIRRVGGNGLRDPWFAANGVANFSFAITLAYVFGWRADLYLFASFWFSIGLHPVGARWIQEHFTTDPDQETTSYYGPLNISALNVGYHNEHHDFPSVPWNRLPLLKKEASEFYDELPCCRSWSGLLWQFISNADYSLASRISR